MLLAPQSLVATQASGQILLAWSGVSGATSYQVQRSVDGVNFSNLGTTTGQLPQYVDTAAIGVMYWYQVQALPTSATPPSPPANPFSNVVQMVAAPPSEMSQYEFILRALQTADRVNSPFFTPDELASFANLALTELYDILITAYEDMYSDQSVYILTNGTTMNYPLPDGVTNYKGGVWNGTTGAPATAIYKLCGVDLCMNTYNPNNTQNNNWLTLNRFNFIDRNRNVYANSNSTPYAVRNMQYREMGANINFIPTPSGGQTVRLWYAAKLPGLLLPSDLTTLGYSGWLRYSIVRLAKYCLDKEEGTDTSKLDAELAYLKTRIEQAASNRDMGQADKISDTQRNNGNGWNGWGGNGGGGGAF